MKKLLVLPVAIAAALSLTPAALACGDDAKACGVCATKAEAPVKKVKGEEMTETFKVTGLKCDNCVKGVSNALGNLTGVNKVHVDLKAHTATVTYVKGHVDLDKLNGALKGHFKLSAVEKAKHHDDHGHHGDHHKADHKKGGEHKDHH